MTAATVPTIRNNQDLFNAVKTYVFGLTGLTMCDDCVKYTVTELTTFGCVVQLQSNGWILDSCEESMVDEAFTQEAWIQMVQGDDITALYMSHEEYELRLANGTLPKIEGF